MVYIKDVWKETFPDEEGKSKSKIEKRKELAKMQREYELQAEEIEKI